MIDVFFCTMPLDGHVNPGLPLAATLVRAGHRVRFSTGRRFANAVESTGARFVPWPAHLDFSEQSIDEAFPERAQLSGIRKLSWDIANIFTASRAALVRDLQQHLRRAPADVLVCDSGCAAPLLLRELGGPPVVVYGTSALTAPSRDVAPFGFALPPRGDALGRLRNRLLHSLMEEVVMRGTRSVADAQRQLLSLPTRRRSAFDTPVPPQALLQLSSAAFEYPRSDLPSFVRFIGFPSSPSRWRNGEEWVPHWWHEVTDPDGAPLVVISQGTVATDPAQLLRPALEALAGEDVRVVALTGSTDARALGAVPRNTFTASHIPYAELFPHASVVVTNGGFGAVQLALTHGVPLVVAGRSEDKAEIAARVAWAGAGVNLRTERPRQSMVRAAVRQVLNDPRFSSAARRLGDAGGHDPSQRALQEIIRIAQTSRRVASA